MKIALCLAGQYRTFDNETVQKTLYKYLLSKYDCDVYFSTWENRGVSLYHGNSIKYKNENDTIKAEDIIKFIPNCVYEIENYSKWKENIKTKVKEAMNRSDICFNAPAQLYKKMMCFSLIPKNKKYDFVIMTRPDLFYINDFEIESLVDEKTIWNINIEGSFAYYPNRIYDILYMGNPLDIQIMAQCYFYIEKLLDDPFNTGLRELDCCKMLFIYANMWNLKVKSVNKYLGDVYRNDDGVRYICKECGIGNII